MLALLLLASPALAAVPDPVPLPSAVPAAVSTTTAVPLDPRRQELLVEMWKRRVLEKGADQPAPEDLKALEELRRAERLGAIDLLREHAGTLRGLAVEHKVRPGLRLLWLTKRGHQQYLFIKSQLARKYFEGRGTDAKWAFKLRDLAGKKLFDGRGVLTPEGDELYTRIQRGGEVEWKDGTGRLQTSSAGRPGTR